MVSPTAPIAAWVTRFLPARGLGIAVGGLLLVTNIRELASTADVGALRWTAYALAGLACAYAALRPRLRQEVVLLPA